MLTVRAWDQYQPEPELGASRHRLTYKGGRHLDALLVTKDSDTLVVSLHGALNRRRFELPRFERLGTLVSWDVSSMYFGDPTLWMDDTIELSWYTGWPGVNVQAHIAHWISVAAQTTSAKRIIVSGSSGGGFGALQVSALIPRSIALVFNPTVKIRGYLVGGKPGAHGTERKYVHTVHPERVQGPIWDFDLETDWTVGLGDEVDALHRYSKPVDNFVLYCQTPTDWHYSQHYLPFLAAAAKGDNLQRVRVHEYGARQGHFPPTPQEFVEGLAKALIWSKSLPDTSSQALRQKGLPLPGPHNV